MHTYIRVSVKRGNRSLWDMLRNDPYSPDRGYFECRDCNTRVASEDRLEDCPDCGNDVRNLAVARE